MTNCFDGYSQQTVNFVRTVLFNADWRDVIVEAGDIDSLYIIGQYREISHVMPEYRVYFSDGLLFLTELLSCIEEGVNAEKELEWLVNIQKEWFELNYPDTPNEMSGELE